MLSSVTTAIYIKHTSAEIDSGQLEKQIINTNNTINKIKNIISVNQKK